MSDKFLRPSRAKLGVLAIAGIVLLAAGGATAALLVRTITLRSGQCVKVGNVRVCAAKVKPRTVTEQETVTVTAAPLADDATIADAFLNQDPNDWTSRVTSFRYWTTPPVLHLVFAAPLATSHELGVTCWNSAAGAGKTSEHVALERGWQRVWWQPSQTACNYYLGDYDLTIRIDGETKSMLHYTITN